MRTYIKLFLSTLYISAFTLGGGIAIVPLIKRKFVDELHYINEREMIDFIAIAQSSPGAMAVNLSFLAGYKKAGVRGALCATFGTVLPPFVIISIISIFYQSFRDNEIVRRAMAGAAPAVAGVIAVSVFDIGRSVLGVAGDRKLSVVTALSAFALSFFFSVNVVYIILACVILGVISAFAGKKL
ncbi:chromate transporter [Clostridia bacterium]|nr:chromate transporter [Clostridia bacterium]